MISVNIVYWNVNQFRHDEHGTIEKGIYWSSTGYKLGSADILLASNLMLINYILCDPTAASLCIVKFNFKTHT